MTTAQSHRASLSNASGNHSVNLSLRKLIDPTFKDDFGYGDGKDELISYNLLFTGRSSENVVET